MLEIILVRMSIVNVPHRIGKDQSADPHSGECRTAGGDKVTERASERAVCHCEHRDWRHGYQASTGRLPKADEQ